MTFAFFFESMGYQRRVVRRITGGSGRVNNKTNWKKQRRKADSAVGWKAKKQQHLSTTINKRQDNKKYRTCEQLAIGSSAVPSPSTRRIMHAKKTKNNKIKTHIGPGDIPLVYGEDNQVAIWDKNVLKRTIKRKVQMGVPRDKGNTAAARIIQSSIKSIKREGKRNQREESDKWKQQRQEGVQSGDTSSRPSYQPRTTRKAKRTMTFAPSPHPPICMNLRLLLSSRRFASTHYYKTKSTNKKRPLCFHNCMPISSSKNKNEDNINNNNKHHN